MPTHSNEHDRYVDKINWLVTTGRDDLIDEVADQYERPESGRVLFWSREQPHWPTRRSA